MIIPKLIICCHQIHRFFFNWLPYNLNPFTYAIENKNKDTVNMFMLLQEDNQTGRSLRGLFLVRACQNVNTKMSLLSSLAVFSLTFYMTLPRS